MVDSPDPSGLRFLEAVRKARGEHPERGPAAVFNFPTGTAEDTPYGIAALHGECDLVASAPEGTRNETLNKAAFRMARVVAAGKLTEETARVNLAAAARACGLPEPEISLVLRQNGATAAGKAHPRVVPDLPPIPEVTPWLPPNSPSSPAAPTATNGAATTTATAANGTAATAAEPSDSAAEPATPDDTETLLAAVREHLPALDWHALFADDTEEEWIVEPLLPARRLVALYSPPKVGKSLLMLEIAAQVARGKPVLGVTPDRPRRVLYVDFENDPKGDVRERLVDMGYGPDDLGNLVYLSFPNLAALDSDRGGLELLAAVDVYGCEVVVIDTVSRSIKGEENENDTWLAFYRHTGLRLKQAGVALIRLDHTGKDETKGQRGGSAKSGDVDAVWRLSRVTEDTYRLECEAARMQVAEKVLILQRITGPLRHTVEGAGRAAVHEARVAAVAKALDTAGLPADVGSHRAREVVRAAGIRARNDVIADAIRARKMGLGPVPTTRGPVGNGDRSPRSGDRWGPPPDLYE